MVGELIVSGDSVSSMAGKRANRPPSIFSSGSTNDGAVEKSESGGVFSFSS